MALRYLGRRPDADFSVIDKKYTDDRYEETKVDTAFVNDEIASQGSVLVSTAYVNAQDALRARKADVDAADATYLATSTVGASNGIAPLDGSAYVPSAKLPTLVTNRKPFFVPATTTVISGDHTVTTTNVKEYQAATLTINDPGFPYIPLISVQIQGGSVGGVAANRTTGTGCFGQITVLKSDDDAKYAWGLATSHKTRAYHNAFPFADSTISPTSRPPLTGTQTFNLWLSCFSGNTYTFNSTGLNFHALVVSGF